MFCIQEIYSAFFKDKSICTKQGCADLVTETDKAVEKMIIHNINEKYPTHKYVIHKKVVNTACELI